jgi:hypothetical protein
MDREKTKTYTDQEEIEALVGLYPAVKDFLERCDPENRLTRLILREPNDEPGEWNHPPGWESPGWVGIGDSQRLAYVFRHGDSPYQIYRIELPNTFPPPFDTLERYIGPSDTLLLCASYQEDGTVEVTAYHADAFRRLKNYDGFLTLLASIHVETAARELAVV